MSWLDNYSTTNTFRSMYINGFMDISGGRLQTRSVTDGHLLIAGDASLNGNLYVGGDISWNPNSLANNSIPSSAIIGGVGGSGLDTDADVTLNKRLFVSEDVSVNLSLIVGGDALLGGIYNKLISSVAQTTFGSNETTTNLTNFGVPYIYNQPTTDGNTTTLMGPTNDPHVGESVAISDDGTIVAVGSPGGKFSNYNRLGYIEIKQLNGAGTAYNRIGLLIGATGNLTGNDNNVRLGSAVALNGDGTIIAASSPYNPSGGIVQVFQYNGSSWSQLGSDIAGVSRIGDQHNTLSLNTAGTILAVSDRRAVSNTGVVRVYEYSSGSWSQIGSDIDGEAVGDYCGNVSLNSSGSIIAVGAHSNHGDAANYTGHVRVFEYSAGSWSQLGTDIDGEEYGDSSGISVSMDGTGTIVAIGAQGNDANGNSSGHVRVYEYDSGTTTWSQKGADIDGSSSGHNFGSSVSLNSTGDTFAVGARGANNSYGYVQMYHYSSSSWTQVGTQQSGTSQYDMAGRSIGISKNNTIVVYGAADTSYARSNAGWAKVYQVSKTELVYDSNGVLQTDDTYRSDRGLVGIGITNPSYEVDISGTIQVSGDISASGLYVSGDISWNPTSLANNSIPSSAVVREVMLFDAVTQGTGINTTSNMYDLEWKVYGSVNFFANTSAKRCLLYHTTTNIHYHCISINLIPGIYKVTVTAKLTEALIWGFDNDHSGKFLWPNGSGTEDGDWNGPDPTIVITTPVYSNTNFHFCLRDVGTVSAINNRDAQILFERIGTVPNSSGQSDQVLADIGTLNSGGSFANQETSSIRGGLQWTTTLTKPTDPDEYLDLNESGTEWIYRIS